MGIDVSTLKPAVEKAKNVATEAYVDNGIASIDVSSSVNSGIATNNDVFAQKLGYANYASMVNAASSGNTIINGGYIRGGLIEAGSIVANHIRSGTITADKINTTGLVAQNVVVPGANGNGNIFSADNNKVIISNLKVLGTASLPGLSKAVRFDAPSTSMPVSVNGNNTGYKEIAYAYISKPYACSSWSIFLTATATCASGSGSSKDLGVMIVIDGWLVVSSQSASAPFTINTVAAGSASGIVSESIHVSFRVNGYNSQGTVYGTMSGVSIVEA